MSAAAVVRRALAGATALLVLLGCAVRAQQSGDGAPARRPNVLLLLADDLRRDALGCHGNSYARTPNLDRLAAQGMRFDRISCMGSRHGAVCIASRAMLLAGNGLHSVRDDLQGSVTVPELLRAAGYRTFAVGKWHNGEEALVRAFPEAASVMRAGMSDHFDVPLCDVVGGKVVDGRRGSKHSSELFADAAIDQLKDVAARAGGEPFFGYVAFSAPHDPRDAPKEWRERFAGDLPELPPNFRGQHGLDLGADALLVRDEMLAAWPRDPQVIRRQLADYHALLAHLDEQVGRVLAAVDALGLAPSTLVVFASDQGLALGSHGLLGKQSLYEHSVGTVLLVRGPGVVKGATPARGHLFDLAATILEAAGVVPPEAMASRSLWPQLRDPAAPGRDAIFLSFGARQRAVVEGRFKLIRLPAIGRSLLFDLVADPYEVHDLAADPARAGDVERLTRLLLAQQAAWGDTLPLTAPSLDPAEVDLTGHERVVDRWQPQWIRDAYFR